MSSNCLFSCNLYWGACEIKVLMSPKYEIFVSLFIYKAADNLAKLVVPLFRYAVEIAH